MAAESLALAGGAPRRRACVLDTSLALSPYGLLLAQRLSAEFELWLVRELWEILDNTSAYVTTPALLNGADVAAGAGDASEGNAGEGDGAEGLTLVRETLRQWDVARGERDLAGLHVFWIGDSLRDSLLPAGLDPQLAARFEALGRSLDARAGAAGDPSGDAPGAASGAASGLAGCARDAVALTVALCGCRAFILTVRAGDGPADAELAEPPLCTVLRRWGIPCTRVGPGPGVDAERRALESQLGRAGVAELLWAGLRLAAVHVVARRAAAIPTVGVGAAGAPDDPLADEEFETDWWQGSVGFWYPLVSE